MARYVAIEYARNLAAKYARFAPARPSVRSWESVLTMMMGGPSMAIGFLVLAATILGLSGYSLGGMGQSWNIGVFTGNGCQYQANLVTGKHEEVRIQIYKPGTQVVFVPDGDMFWLPVSGWILGLIGMILGGVRRRFSVWSALGLSEHSATMLLVAGSAQILHLMP